MEYRRCGKSGLLLPAISLGLWHNFATSCDFHRNQSIVCEAFERGITHFDLADNYGPPPGSAETTFGRILRRAMAGRRDQIVITSKAGHEMWPGPYGDWGSRKHLIAACDQSLGRLGVDYVDIFYSHRPDPETPIEETMLALDHIVRSGRALYVGLSKYSCGQLTAALAILRELRTPVVVGQLKYSMLVRDAESELLEALEHQGLGCVSFSPLAQGQLSERYLDGIPSDSRAAGEGFLKSTDVRANIDRVRQLSDVASRRGQSLSQMAIAWQLATIPGQPARRVTSVIVGVSSSEQLRQNLDALNDTSFSPDELRRIDEITNPLNHSL